MATEVIGLPGQIQRQNKDWNLLLGRYPILESFGSNEIEIATLLKGPHTDYVNNVSSPLISVPLNMASFLYFLSVSFAPKRIIDLGSGFSSFVFHKAINGLPSSCDIISVDDSTFWLEKTRAFLSRHNIQGCKLMTLDNLLTMPNLSFDLAFLDLGTYEDRMELLPTLLDNMNQKGCIVVDDFHSPGYRKKLHDLIHSKPDFEIFSLRKVTRRRLSHGALIARTKLNIYQP